MAEIFGTTTTTPMNPDIFSGGGSERIPKIITEGHTVGFKRAIALTGGIAGKPLGTKDEDYVAVDIVDNKYELPYLGGGGAIATYDNGGRLYTNTPIDDLDCANKGYVDDAVSKISGLKITVVAELPQTGETDTLYFVPATNSQEQNLYDEYIYADGAWEKIGSASVEVDLTDYVKNTDWATTSKAGIVLINAGKGIGRGNTIPVLEIQLATTTEIDAKVSAYKPITPRNLDHAVKVGITTNTETLTDDEKASAQAWLGITELVGDIETLLGGI